MEPRADEMQSSAWWVEWDQGGIRRRLEVNRPLSIGRNPGSDICLTEPSVSRQHALIAIVDGRPRVDATASRNGIVVGGSRATLVSLDSGQSFQIAGSVLRVVRIPTAVPSSPQALPAPVMATGPDAPAGRSGGRRRLAGGAIAASLVAAGLIVGTIAVLDRPVGPTPTSPPVTVHTPAPSAQADSAGPANTSDSMVAAVAKAGPSVVLVQTDEGLGSGVVYDDQGHIVTNAHVVEGASRIRVKASDGRQRVAVLVGLAAEEDIAVIRVDGSGLTPAVFGDSSRLQVGQSVLAIGNPLGVGVAVTEGIVSATGRQMAFKDGTSYPDVIQTDAEINPGNSGGALIDLSGQVVGIPTFALADPNTGAHAPGMGFAISSNRACLIADQLIAASR